MIEVSAGIIIWKKDGDYIKFFVCTPGGPAWSDKELWNFPKGHLEDGETPFEAAVREFKEETGVYPGSLNNRDYKYHGLIKQRSNKNVYVYSKEYSGEDFSDCHSNTFLWTDGKEYPEIGKYAWLTLDDIKEKGGTNSTGSKTFISCNEYENNDGTSQYIYDVLDWQASDGKIYYSDRQDH